jgi:limonene-1,2-epoxide hydrolase
VSSPASSVHAFIGAVQSRDLDAVELCFTEDASYANVGEPAAVGRSAIRAMLAPILTRSSRVVWEVHAEAYSGDLVFAERTDRFWIDEREYAVQCNGVYRIDSATGLIAEVRDYVDLGRWREQLGSVLAENPGAE